MGIDVTETFAKDGDGRSRCGWVSREPLYIAYHDEEWGVPVRDDKRLFEFLVLETAQAGLSWYTILKKRERYRAAFAGFDAEKVANYTDVDVFRLLNDRGIVRNRRKILATVGNARAFLRVREEFGTFSEYMWRFVDDRPLVNHWPTLADVPAVTDQSIAMSKDMKRRGFTFVGPTVCYAHMQATGMVMDHLISCFRHAELCGVCPSG